jgi:regulation of enolase protein 1 (concanavalin A-like superfamily)
MEWLNEPASWQRTGDVLTVSVDPSTDFWRETGYGYIRDSGHVYGEVLAGDLDVSVRMRCTLGTQYDQAGVMLRADERTWLKTGVEFFEGRARLSTVLTLGRSSWMVTDLPEGTDEIVLRVSRRGDAVEVRYVIEDGPAELAALVFMPPGREVLAGVMAAAPEGPGFRVTFHDLRITEPDWSGSAEGGTSWPGDQAGWTGDEQPAWSAADGGPGWPAPETGEEAPAWPATAEEEPPAWPVPATADEEPQWPAHPAGDDDPQWPVPAAQEDDPGRRATAGEEEGPGWEPPGDDEAGWVAALAGDGDDEPAWAAAPAAAGTGVEDRDGVHEPAAADSPGQAGREPAGTDFADAGPADAGPAGAGAAGAGAAGAGPIAAALAGPEPVSPGPAEPEAARDEPGAQDAAAARPAAEEPAAEESAARNGDGEPWSPAPLAGHLDWARPASGGAAAGVDPAADWERLAAGAQAATRAQATGAQAARWRAQTDADVADEWPGPPLRTAMRNGLLAGDAGPGPAAGQSVADAQTDPGLSRPRPAAEEPGRTEAGLPTPPEAGSAGPGENSAATPPKASATGPDETGPAAPARPDQPDPAQPAREARRGRSRRAAADVPTEPDAADEWISLLTADPVEE